MNLDTKYIKKMKNIYYCFKYYSSNTNIYIKKKHWKKWELKNQRIILLSNRVNSAMKLVKVFKAENNYKKVCIDVGIAAVFIDKETSYLYFKDKIFEIYTHGIGFIGKQVIEYPIYPLLHPKEINNFNDEELKELIKSYMLLGEFI